MERTIWVRWSLEVSQLAKLKFVDKPSLAVLNQVLSKRFNKEIAVRVTDDGIELEADFNPGDIARLEMMFERWGYLLETG